MKSNTDIRKYARGKGVRLWEVALALNISEPTITRRLRVELSDADKAQIFAIIDRVAAQHAAQIAATATN